jgi:hypothetical protein
LPVFRQFLESLRRARVELLRVRDAADAVTWDEAPTSCIRRAKVVGRSGWVAMQASAGTRA